MLCSIYKWKISRALDSGKPLSGLAERHLRRCSACREFARVGRELEQRLTQDAATLLENNRISLGEKVLSSLDRRVESPSVSKRILGKPVWVAAAVSALVLVAAIVATRISFVTPRSEKIPALESILKYNPPGVYLKKAAQKAESPYQMEIQELKKALGTAAGVIEASLDIGLGGQTDQEKPMFN